MSPALFTQRELWHFRIAFLVLVAYGMGTYLLADATVLESVVAGGTIGGLVFLPLALVYGVYLMRKRPAGVRA